MTLTQTVCPNYIALRAGKQGAYSADVKPPAIEFKKSTTEPKPKPKLLTCKSTVHIVTFNVKTLNRLKQLPAVEHNIEIICIQEQILP